MKKHFQFPLSYDDIGKIVGNKDDANYQVEGVLMVKKSIMNNNPELQRTLSYLIFKNVYDEWDSQRPVVVGKDKLLCTCNVSDFSILEKDDSINGLTVIRVKADLNITSDPEYSQEIKRQIKEHKKLQTETNKKYSI